MFAIRPIYLMNCLLYGAPKMHLKESGEEGEALHEEAVEEEEEFAENRKMNKQQIHCCCCCCCFAAAHKFMP